MKVELLYFEGCPGSVETLGILESVIAQRGLAAEIVPVTPDPGDWSGFPGSPTILVDGEDLFPAGRQDPRRAASCRIYTTPEGPKNHPTAEMVRKALAGLSPDDPPPGRG